MNGNQLFLLIFIFLWGNLMAPSNHVNAKVTDDLRRRLIKVTTNMDLVFEHSNASKGFGEDGEFEAEPRHRDSPGQPEHEDDHDMIASPPFLGSFCNFKEYQALFGPYYKVPFQRQDQRLYFNRKILERFDQAGDEFAWSVCQFGKIKLECLEESSRCECLDESPPDKYVETEDLNCVGVSGSICTNQTKAPILCRQGLECIDGYCGGIEAIGNLLESNGCPALWNQSGLKFIVLVLILILFN